MIQEKDTISREEWSNLKTLHSLLEPFSKLATLFEADESPTLSLVVLYYDLLLETLTAEAERKSCVIYFLSECSIEAKPAVLLGRDQEP